MCRTAAGQGASITRAHGLVVATLLLAIACGGESRAPRSTTAAPQAAPETADSAARETAAPRPAAPPRRAMQRNVVIEEPKDGATVATNPISLRGRARTFENHVEIRVDDAHGHPMVTRHATARGEIGRFNPFSDEVFVTVNPGERLTITAIERSAEDGSIRSRHAVTMRLAAPKAHLVLYFPNENRRGEDCTDVQRLVRDVPASIAPARLALEALLRGPSQPELVAGFRNPFPRGAALRSVNLKGGVLTADFNQAMQNVGGSCRVASIRAAIERTLREIPGVERVVITAMGDEKTALQP